MEQQKMATNPAVWFEIYVDDLDRATKFYQTVLGMQLFDLPTPGSDFGEGLKMMAFPMEQGAPNAGGTLVKMDGVKAGGNSTIIYFASEDCTTEESRVEAAGGRIFKPKMAIGEYGFVSLCFDSEGNIFGLHSRK